MRLVAMIFAFLTMPVTLLAEPRVDGPEGIYNRGVKQYQEGKYAEARQSFEQAARQGDLPLKARSFYNLGNAQAMLGQYGAAKEAYQNALSYDLDNKMIKENLAWAEEQEKKQEQKQQPSEEQKTEDEKSNERKPENQQPDEQKSDNQKSDEQKSDKQNQSSQDQKPDQSQQKNQETAPKPENAGQNKPEPASEPRKGEEGSKPQPSQTAAAAKQPAKKGELSREEAERILRSVDEKVNPSLYRPAGAPPPKATTKDW